MADRQEIARRHGIAHLAHKLVGESAEELDADAQSKAGVIRALSPLDLNEARVEPPEPPIEGLPPADKPCSEYTDEEREATHAHYRRRLRKREKREARLARKRREREDAEANRTEEQRMGDSIGAVLRPGVKREANRSLIESVHPDEGGEG